MKTIARILTAVLLFVSIPVFAGPSIPILQGGVISSATTGGAGLTPTNATNATNATNLVAGGTIASTVGAVTQAAGTSTVQVATTAFVNPSTGSNGNGHWRKSPDGTIQEWNCIGSGLSVTFPLAFPNAVYIAIVEPVYSAGEFANLSAPASTSGFTFVSSGGAGIEHCWYAVGY